MGPDDEEVHMQTRETPPATAITTRALGVTFRATEPSQTSLAAWGPGFRDIASRVADHFAFGASVGAMVRVLGVRVFPMALPATSEHAVGFIALEATSRQRPALALLRAIGPVVVAVPAGSAPTSWTLREWDLAGLNAVTVNDKDCHWLLSLGPRTSGSTPLVPDWLAVTRRDVRRRANAA